MVGYIEFVVIGLILINVGLISANYLSKIDLMFWRLSFCLPILTILLASIATFAMPMEWRRVWDGASLVVFGILLGCLLSVLLSLLSFCCLEKNKFYTLIIAVPSALVVWIIVSSIERAP